MLRDGFFWICLMVAAGAVGLLILSMTGVTG